LPDRSERVHSFIHCVTEVMAPELTAPYCFPKDTPM